MGVKEFTEPWLLDTQASALATEAQPSGFSWLEPVWFPPGGPLLQSDLNLSTAFPPSWPLIILFCVISSQQTSQCRIKEKVTLRGHLSFSLPTNIICGTHWVLETQEGEGALAQPPRTPSAGEGLPLVSTPPFTPARPGTANTRPDQRNLVC